MASRKTKKLWMTAGVCAVLLAILTTGLILLNRESGNPVADIPDTTDVPATEPTTEAEKMILAPESDSGQKNGMTGMMKSMRAYNPDSVGWIRIAGTEVNNPVVKAEDDAYYLDMGFNHEPYRAGTVFLDFRNAFGYDQQTWSDNLILYGHNMANDEMFGSLRRYRQDLNYYKTYPFIELDSGYEHATYVIFALPVTYGGADAEWRYWNMLAFPDETDFNDYIRNAREKSLAEIPVDVQYGDAIITLSTCYRDEDNSRFLVIGRKLREGETAETFAGI